MPRKRNLPLATSSDHKRAAYEVGRRVLDAQGFQYLGRIALEAARWDAEVARLLLVRMHRWGLENDRKYATAKAALEPIRLAIELAAGIKPQNEDGPDVEKLYRRLATAVTSMKPRQVSELTLIPEARVLDLAREYNELFDVDEAAGTVSAKDRFRLTGPLPRP